MRKGWEIKDLADVCDFFNDGNWIESKDQSESGYRLIQTGNIGIGEFRNKSGKERYISEATFKRLRCTEIFEGDILVSRLPDPVGRTCTIPRLNQKMITAVDCTIVRLKKNILLADFFKYYSQSQLYFKDISEKITGTTRDRISRSNLGLIKIVVPPILEQQNIVAILDETFAAIDQAKENLQRNLQNVKELFQSELNETFTSKGEGWSEKKLGEIGKVLMCKRVFKEQTTTTGDIPFYKIGTFGKEPDAFISFEIYKEFREKFSFPKEGDILISASGTIGRRVRYDGKPAYFQDSNIVWIANDEKQVLNVYLYHFYTACKWQTTKGATISRLYNDNLRQIEIAFPKSLSKQKELVEKFDTLSSQTKNLENIYRQKLDNLEELKKSILQKAFRGELTSPERALSVNDGHSPSKKKNKAPSINSPERA